MGKNIGKNISKNLSRKYIQKLLDHAKKYATAVLKTSSWRVIQRTAEATGDLIVNKIANKRYVSPEERQKTIEELRLR